MAKQRTLRVPWEHRQQLQAARDHDRRPYVRERCAALLKIADGQTAHGPRPTAHAVASHGLLKGREPDTVYAWLGHDPAEGLAGLVGHVHGGSPRSRLRSGRAAHPRASG
jgi:hypothetical protein